MTTGMYDAYMRSERGIWYSMAPNENRDNKTKQNVHYAIEMMKMNRKLEPTLIQGVFMHDARELLSLSSCDVSLVHVAFRLQEQPRPLS